MCRASYVFVMAHNALLDEMSCRLPAQLLWGCINPYATQTSKALAPILSPVNVTEIVHYQHLPVPRQGGRNGVIADRF